MTTWSSLSLSSLWLSSCMLISLMKSRWSTWSSILKRLLIFLRPLPPVCRWWLPTVKEHVEDLLGVNVLFKLWMSGSALRLSWLVVTRFLTGLIIVPSLLRVCKAHICRTYLFKCFRRLRCFIFVWMKLHSQFFISLLYLFFITSLTHAKYLIIISLLYNFSTLSNLFGSIFRFQWLLRHRFWFLSSSSGSTTSKSFLRCNLLFFSISPPHRIEFIQQVLCFVAKFKLYAFV